MTSGPSELPSLFGTVVRKLQAFFRLEAASGVLLLGAALAALAWANSDWADAYRATLAYPFVACYVGRNPLSLKKLVVRRARVNRARLIGRDRFAIPGLDGHKAVLPIGFTGGR